jgi:hypothetical protein
MRRRAETTQEEQEEFDFEQEMVVLQGQNSPISRLFSGYKIQLLTLMSLRQSIGYSMFDRPSSNNKSLSLSLSSCQLLNDFQALQPSSRLSNLSSYSDILLSIRNAAENG